MDDLTDEERAMFDSIQVQEEEPAGNDTQTPRRAPSSREFTPRSVSFEEDEIIPNREKLDSEPTGNFQSSGPTEPQSGYQSVDDEKADLLNRIQRLTKKGHQSHARLSVYSSIEEIRAEYKRMSYAIEVDQSVRFQKRMLIACVSGIEFLNKKFDPFDVELDGWSETVMETQDDYDGVFEELFQKYQNKVKVAPEIKLMLMVSGSALMFHMNKTMFKSFKNLNPSNPITAVFSPPVQEPPAVQKRREVRGPGIDLASLSGGMDLTSMMNNMQRNGPQEFDEGSVSDVISIGSDLRDVQMGEPTRKVKRARPKKTEVNL